jgi:hypothetical protein
MKLVNTPPHACLAHSILADLNKNLSVIRHLYGLNAQSTRNCYTNYAFEEYSHHRKFPPLSFQGGDTRLILECFFFCTPPVPVRFCRCHFFFFVWRGKHDLIAMSDAIFFRLSLLRPLRDMFSTNFSLLRPLRDIPPRLMPMSGARCLPA